MPGSSAIRWQRWNWQRNTFSFSVTECANKSVSKDDMNKHTAGAHTSVSRRHRFYLYMLMQTWKATKKSRAVCLFKWYVNCLLIFVPFCCFYLSFSTAVLMAEAVKLLTCLVLVFYENGKDASKFVESLHTTVIKNYIDTVKICVPSLLYVVQNNLLYISASHLDAATYQVNLHRNIASQPQLNC